MKGCGALVMQHPANKSFTKHLVAASDIRLVQSQFYTFVHLGVRVQDIQKTHFVRLGELGVAHRHLRQHVALAFFQIERTVDWIRENEKFRVYTILVMLDQFIRLYVSAAIPFIERRFGLDDQGFQEESVGLQSLLDNNR